MARSQGRARGRGAAFLAAARVTNCSTKPRCSPRRSSRASITSDASGGTGPLDHAPGSGAVGPGDDRPPRVVAVWCATRRHPRPAWLSAQARGDPGPCECGKHRLAGGPQRRGARSRRTSRWSIPPVACCPTGTPGTANNLPAPQLEYRRELETYLANKAEQMLCSAGGRERDPRQCRHQLPAGEGTAGTYSPNPVVGAERLTSIKSSGGGPRGGGGAVSNVPRAGVSLATPGGGGGGSTSTEEVLPDPTRRRPDPSAISKIEWVDLPG